MPSQDGRVQVGKSEMNPKNRLSLMNTIYVKASPSLQYEIMVNSLSKFLSTQDRQRCGSVPPGTVRSGGQGARMPDHVPAHLETGVRIGWSDIRLGVQVKLDLCEYLLRGIACHLSCIGSNMPPV